MLSSRKHKYSVKNEFRYLEIKTVVFLKYKRPLFKSCIHISKLDAVSC